MNILILLGSIACFICLVAMNHGSLRPVVSTFNVYQKIAWFVTLGVVAFLATANAAIALYTIGLSILPIITLGVAIGWAIIYRKGW